MEFLSEELIDKISKTNEKIVRKQFEKSNLNVTKLDKGGKNEGKRPDFLVSDSTHKIICEVKTVLSLDYNICYKDQKIGHFSAFNPKLDKSGKAFSYDPSTKINSKLEESVCQYNKLIKDEPIYKNTPFCVALFIELFHTNSLISGHLENFQEISALLKIIIDYELHKKLEKYSKDELVEIFERKRKVKLPPHTKRWEVLSNKKAPLKLPLFFFGDAILINN